MLAVTVLCFDAEPSAAVREMARMVTPGGRLMLGELAAFSAWSLWRRMRALFGASLWRRATLRSPAQLCVLLRDAGLSPGPVRGAVYYPPLLPVARLMAPFDRLLSSLNSIGAAFLAVTATRSPAQGELK